MNQAKHNQEDSIACRQCDGDMVALTVKKYDGKWPLFLIIGGFFSCFFLGGPLLGVPVLLMGIYMLAAEITILYCQNCGRYCRAAFTDDELD